ncbi:hypothetical protein QAD02_000720 [Eretmocerus hayati]|uniref:Uncharacterized protein n=1 Tax=Eretmocerus hayati TaxID=131215 RepID=A0ACC2NFL8_9HYME|nr:hypothetical protein QAD02_000720 [Eretmocerus hayati]
MALSLWNLTPQNLSDIIDERFNVDACDGYGAPLLLLCISCQRRDLMQVLLNHGADPNLGTNADEIGLPLQVAVNQCRFDFVKMLITHGANIAHIERMPDVLSSALRTGNPDLTRYLHHQGLDPHITFSDMSNLLIAATRWNYSDLVQHLMSLTPRIHQPDSHGFTCIFHAVICKNLKLVRLFINDGANVNMHDNIEVYLMGYAISTGRRDIVMALISAGANLNEMDSDHVHCNAAQPILQAGYEEW